MIWTNVRALDGQGKLLIGNMNDDAVGIREDLSDIITNISPKSLGRQSVMISCNWVNCWKAKFTKVNMPISSEASKEERSTTRGGDLVEPSGSKRLAPYYKGDDIV